MATTRTETPGPYTPPARDLSSTAARYGVSVPTAGPAPSTSAFNPNDETTWRVYLGTKQTASKIDPFGGKHGVRVGDSTTSFADASSRIFNWAKAGDPRFNQVVGLMYEANLIPEEWDLKQVASVWNWAVAQSATMLGQGTGKMTPEEYLMMSAKSAASGRGGAARSSSRGGSGSGPSSRSYTQTSTNVDLSNAETAKAIINKALEDALGRAANDDEIKQFHASLNAKEQANPTKTVSQVTQLASGGGSSSSTTTGGFDGTSKMQFAEDTAKNNGEFAEYQAATTYFDAMMQALQAPTGA